MAWKYQIRCHRRYQCAAVTPNRLDKEVVKRGCSQPFADETPQHVQLMEAATVCGGNEPWFPDTKRTEKTPTGPHQ